MKKLTKNISVLLAAILLLAVFVPAAPAVIAHAEETAHVHTPGEPVKEEGVPSTCTSNGYYYKVTYCTECGQEISRTKQTDWSLGHFGGLQMQYYKDDDGTYYQICVNCGEKIGKCDTLPDNICPYCLHYHLFSGIAWFHSLLYGLRQLFGIA